MFSLLRPLHTKFPELRARRWPRVSTIYGRTTNGDSRRKSENRSLNTSHAPKQQRPWRHLHTLAIETSCDDTSVAILRVSRDDSGTGEGASKLKSEVLFHEKVTAKSESYGGIHPLVALHSHQQSLGPLVQKALEQLDAISCGRNGERRKGAQWRPDFVSATRGPGLDTAKGLALAWGVPLLGVHHMQAHALTPRLCSTLPSTCDPGQTTTLSRGGGSSIHTPPRLPQAVQPDFPFLSVLASGGHTMLIESKSLVEHKTLAETGDIAIGTCLDKTARAILPPELLVPPYGRALEKFAFPDSEESYKYTPPARRQEELEVKETMWGWFIGPPLAGTGYGKSNKRMLYSFTGMFTHVDRLMAVNPDRSVEERRDMAREVMRIAFEHLASRILLYLKELSPSERKNMSTVVVSGGVAANTFLRHVLRAFLDVRGHNNVKLEFPPIELCMDNALMIAWAGMEMFNAGYESSLDVQPIRKWSMDSAAEDGGILGVGGWRNWDPQA
ncbi:Mitochondrial tRNAs modification protein [Extremus antarcticus]|uniref:N(6)-L-threonylcarbamoyladenine synthase n=1 Tax=Extremus antarcticus TaxID=702011 RepID=A0AAJ0GBP9_9PEZI|nr:Mitochondrial tRNAs modification protein [Extremus antarcticus]